MSSSSSPNPSPTSSKKHLRAGVSPTQAAATSGEEDPGWAAMLPSASCRAKIKAAAATFSRNTAKGESGSSDSSSSDEEAPAVVTNRFATLNDENSKKSHTKKERRGTTPPQPGTPADIGKLGQARAKPTQLFDFFLVLDFEATCEENEFDFEHEIIEFPVVVVDAARNCVAGEFHSFVKPRRNKGKLTKFCRELTGITQEQVDAAPPIEQVIRNFTAWYEANVPAGAKTVFATDGPWDMREFMFRHSVVRDGVEFPKMFYTYIDLRHTFANWQKCKPRGVQAMLAKVNLTFEGRQHSGIDDTRNIARILMQMIHRGHKFENLAKVQEDRVRLDMLARMKRNGLLEGEGNVKGKSSAPKHDVGCGGGGGKGKRSNANGSAASKMRSPKSNGSNASAGKGPQFPASPPVAKATTPAGSAKAEPAQKKPKETKASKKAQQRAAEFESD